MSGRGWRPGRAALPLLLALACAPGPPPEPAPPPAAEEEALTPAEAEVLAEEVEERERLLEPGELPPIPEVDGALRIRVQYPAAYQRIAARDSNFVFGQLGTGRALLWIDGQPVPVEPNGAFLAWLPVPPRTRGDTAFYRVRAVRGEQADSLLLPVVLPRRPYVGPTGRVWLDTAVLTPMPERWALPDEPLELGVRGAAGMDVWLEVGVARIPLYPERPAGAARTGPEAEGQAIPAVRYRSDVAAGPLRAAACPPVPLPPPGCRLTISEAPDTLALTLVATDGRDTVRLTRTLPLRLLDSGTLPLARLEDVPDPEHGRSGYAAGRPTPVGSYRWLLPPGATVRVDGRVGPRFRVRLAPDLVAWLGEEELSRLPGGTPPPVGPVGDLRVEPGPEALTVRVPLRVPLPAVVTQPDARTLELTVYGAYGETDRVAHGPADPLLESLRWEQLPGARYRVVLRLTRPVWGWRISFERGDADAYEGLRAEDLAGPGGDDPILRLDVRRPPEIDPDRPLRGRRVAVDPGHPGAGAYGPTGYYEGDANLAVARRLVERLREAGAEPILIRRDTLPLGLYRRVHRAVQADAEIFVSIHNNALPDGIRPFGREGTSTYYYHAHSADLAAALQQGMSRRMGLRDLGVAWGNLAVARESWLPAVLTEGAFMMIPAHEAALRTEEFQDRYARGVLDGLTAFLRQRARPGPEPE